MMGIRGEIKGVKEGNLGKLEGLQEGKKGRRETFLASNYEEKK